MHFHYPNWSILDAKLISKCVFCMSIIKFRFSKEIVWYTLSSSICFNLNKNWGAAGQVYYSLHFLWILIKIKTPHPDDISAKRGARPIYIHKSYLDGPNGEKYIKDNKFWNGIQGNTMIFMCGIETRVLYIKKKIFLNPQSQRELQDRKKRIEK